MVTTHLPVTPSFLSPQHSQVGECGLARAVALPFLPDEMVLSSNGVVTLAIGASL